MPNHPDNIDELKVLTSGARTTNQAFGFNNSGGSTLNLNISVTGNAQPTASMTVSIDGWDVGLSTWVTLVSTLPFTAATLTAAGGVQEVRQLSVNPAQPAVANQNASAALPARVRVRCSVATADSITYSIGGTLAT